MTRLKLTSPHHNIWKGSLFAIFAFFAMAVFGILTRQGYQYGDPIWVSLITYTIASIGVTLLIVPQGYQALKSHHYGALIARAVIGTLASFLYMISMRYISIVNSTLLFNTAPLFIPLITLFWFKVPVRPSLWYAVLIGFIGIIIIIKPGTDLFTDPGNVIGLSAGIALSIAYILMKLLTDTETGLRIIFYYFTIGMLIQIPLLIFTKGLPPYESVIYAGLSGMALFIAQIALVKAYTYAEAAEVGVYQYSSIIFVALIDWLIWDMKPGWSVFIGFILVSLAGIMIIRTGKKTEHTLKVKKIKRWKRAAKLVAENNDEVNQEFQKHSKIKTE